MHNEKAELRSRLLAQRRELAPEWRETAAATLAALAAGLAEPGGTVAAYVSVGTEPGTRPLLDALRARGVRVLLPVLLPDNDLDWAEYEGADLLAAAGRGLLEPTGPRLGPEAVTDAALVLSLIHTRRNCWTRSPPNRTTSRSTRRSPRQGSTGSAGR